MSIRLFNSPFEMELRSLLLLSVCGKNPVSVERLVALDFISCYGADFGLPVSNLHGCNRTKFGELSNRRMLVQEAIKGLVTKGMADVSLDHGYKFMISANGKKYVRKFESDYSQEYKSAAKEAVKKYKKKSDEEIMEEIQDCSIQSLRG